MNGEECDLCKETGIVIQNFNIFGRKMYVCEECVKIGHRKVLEQCPRCLGINWVASDKSNPNLTLVRCPCADCILKCGSESWGGEQ